MLECFKKCEPQPAASDRLTFLVLFVLDVGLRSVLQHVDVLRVWLENFAAHCDGSACLLALLNTQNKHTALTHCSIASTCLCVCVFLPPGVRCLTCASAWQIRSLASRVKWCTLGSVFITAMYLLTASSYVKEQKAGSCLNGVSLLIQRDAAWIISPTHIIQLMLCTLFSLVNMMSRACQIWCDIHSYPEGICMAACATRKSQCLEGRKPSLCSWCNPWYSRGIILFFYRTVQQPLHTHTHTHANLEPLKKITKTVVLLANRRVSYRQMLRVYLWLLLVVQCNSLFHFPWVIWCRFSFTEFWMFSIGHKGVIIVSISIWSMCQILNIFFYGLWWQLETIYRGNK